MYKYVQKTLEIPSWRTLDGKVGKEEGRKPECSKGREGGEKEGGGKMGKRGREDFTENFLACLLE